MSFTYGLFIPVLFPIALVGIFNMYVVERLSLAYYYRQPPMFDERLNKRAIDLLQGAPILMFLMSYWAYGNRQVFFNTLPEVKEHGNDVMNTLHNPFDTDGPNHTYIILGAFCFFFFEIMVF